LLPNFGEIIMTRLSWTNDKITSWVLSREVTARFGTNKLMLGEMRIIERLAVNKLGFSGVLNKDQQIRAELEATRIVNNSCDNIAADKIRLDIVKTLLEFADREIIDKKIVLGQEKLLDANGEVELLFKFIQDFKRDGYVPDIVSSSPARLKLFNDLLQQVIAKSADLGLIIQDFVNAYNLEHNGVVVSDDNPPAVAEEEEFVLLNNQTAYTPARDAGVGNNNTQQAASTPDTLQVASIINTLRMNRS
jgi:hypothetical protein